MSSTRILVTDDSLVARTACSNELKEAGYQVLFAQNGREAVETVSREAVDLILMDVVMPEMNGVEATRKIKAIESAKDIPVIMVTSMGDMQTLESAFEAGAVDYVTKPIEPIELMARIRSALRLKEEMDARKKREEELTKKNQQLELALSEIKTLQGFIPICAWCKKIRNIEGYWEQMEHYIEGHSQATFSHSICKECAAKQMKKPKNKT
jgi:sigma-B regulation protein RsbU (phosphoserine phosphatase)